jgi:hypothetical protein
MHLWHLVQTRSAAARNVVQHDWVVRRPRGACRAAVPCHFRVTAGLRLGIKPKVMLSLCSPREFGGGNQGRRPDRTRSPVPTQVPSERRESCAPCASEAAVRRALLRVPHVAPRRLGVLRSTETGTGATVALARAPCPAVTVQDCAPFRRSTRLALPRNGFAFSQRSGPSLAQPSSGSAPSSSAGRARRRVDVATHTICGQRSGMTWRQPANGVLY